MAYLLLSLPHLAAVLLVVGCTTPSALDRDVIPEDVPGEIGDPSPDAPTADVGEPACGSCHGSAEHPAPPPGLSGAALASDPGVGAHAAHLAPSTVHAEVRCRHCHAVPATVAAPGHVDDDRPADVVLSGLAATGVEPAYTPAGCTTWCHGSGLRIAPRASPPWTGAQEGCTACHDLPPAAPHPAAPDCGRCHLEVADAEGNLLRAVLHVDGALQAPHGAHLLHLGARGRASVDLPCTRCHQGTAYHGALIDGGTLETTTLCAACHPADFDPLAWRTPSL